MRRRVGDQRRRIVPSANRVVSIMTENGSPLPLLSRYAIMVDVGYIYASAGELLFGAASRREYKVDADKLIQALTRHADDRVRGELLRVYWYDAARDRVPTIDQRVIAQMPWVKLRLGNLNARGQQKGVDAQIRADMEALARPRAITDAVLWAGGEDMVPPGGEGGVGRGGEGRAGGYGRARRGPEKERVEEAGEHVAQKWILTRGEDNIRDLLPGPILPPVIDKELLVDAEKELGLSLRPYQEAREWLRDAFWARVHRQFGIGVGKSRS